LTQKDEGSLRSQASGSELIAAERLRQIKVEGWTPKHDADHGEGSLALAAVCYATPYEFREPHGKTGAVPYLWPWRIRDWKPTADRVRELTKAGALIAAEIDRLLREERARRDVS
jgi:hypothetical protein